MTHLFLLLLAGQAVPAPPVPSCSPEHEAMGHCSSAPNAAAIPEPGPAESQAGQEMPAAANSSCPPDHAAMGHCSLATAGPHAAHAAASPEVAVAPPPPQALGGPDHAADTVWSPADMARSREVLRREHGDIRVGKVVIDRLELGARQGRDQYAWDAQAWWGSDLDKVWLKSEGEAERSRRVERVEVQALWSHAIGPWFDVQAGLRHDFGRGPERSYFALGVEGLAPYWIALEATAFLSDKGELSARMEAEHDVRLTQRLILQPRAALDLQLKDVPERRIGSGVENGEMGLRLRYEILPQFAPYVGVGLDRAFGKTLRFRRAAGEDAGGWAVLLGVRAWF